ncbi:hypothetical protein CHELA20_50174 [Hyphomicrobiales bacterium]|nr:hypothetical protein CHELA41_20197 [Hyphomicrobiales bacterium]CAH1667204.1 hypothetical protein CHELA20_50174 [Hyphomicrobiales bacterium]
MVMIAHRVHGAAPVLLLVTIFPVSTVAAVFTVRTPVAAVAAAVIPTTVPRPSHVLGDSGKRREGENSSDEQWRPHDYVSHILSWPLAAVFGVKRCFCEPYCT